MAECVSMTTVLDTPASLDVPSGHGLMSTLDKNAGDLRVMWDHANPDEVNAAREQFDDLRGKGYLAYQAEGKAGDKGALIREFDAEAERIILVKPSVGG